MAGRLAGMAIALGGLASGCGGDGGKATPESSWAAKNRLPGFVMPGARLFVKNGCLTCHTYLGKGNRIAGSPDLTDEGAKGKGVAFQIAHLKCPSCLSPGSPMPGYASLGAARLRQIAIFLEASKGGK